MAKNIGKQFEDDWKKSVPEYALIYRLPDSAQSFGRSKTLRFSAKSPFDFLMWDSKKHLLYALEMKTVGGKSISFERTKDDNGAIHYHQIKGLNGWSRFNGITCGFVIDFRQEEKTIFIEIKEFNKLISAIKKKSFNLEDLDNENIRYILIERIKMRTRYKYNIDKFLMEQAGNGEENVKEL